MRELQKAKLQKFSKKKCLNSKPENEIRLGGFTWEIIRNNFHQILGAILSRTLIFCNLPLIYKDWFQQRHDWCRFMKFTCKKVNDK